MNQKQKKILARNSSSLAYVVLIKIKKDMESNQELKEMFNQIDTQNTGTITFKSLTKTLSPYSALELREVTTQNFIDFQEFTRVIIALTNEIEVQKASIQAFKVFDKEGTGTLKAKDLKDTLSEETLCALPEVFDYLDLVSSTFR